MAPPLDAAALDRLFRAARTYRAWQDRPIPEATLRAVWDLARLGPTAANCSPARIVFVVSREAKEMLRPCLDPGNVEKAMTAPATAVIGYDLRFYEHMERLAPGSGARGWYEGKAEATFAAAFRNGTLQGAYLMLAARALGLDCGPMSGFDNAKVDAAFFPESAMRSNFLCNLGFGDVKGTRPRADRFAFDEACRIA